MARTEWRRNSCVFGVRLTEDVVCRGQILDRDPQRLEQGDLARPAARGRPPDQDVPELRDDVVRGQSAFLDRDQQVGDANRP